MMRGSKLTCAFYVFLLFAVMAGASAAVGAPRTVTTLVTVPSDAEVPEVAVQLVGLSFGSDKAPPSVSLVWAPRSFGGWLSTWELGMNTAEDLMVAPRVDKKGPDSQHDILGPTPGHTYEATVSYDAASGIVSAAVVDLTSGIRLYAENARVRSSEGPLYPSRLDAPLPVVIESQRTAAAFVPVGAEWEVLTRDEATEAFVPIHTVSPLSPLFIDRRHHKEIGLQLTYPAEITAGHFQMVAVDAHGSRSIIPIARTAENRLLSVQTSRLPVGQTQLMLEYVYDGNGWMLGTRPLHVGAIEVVMVPLEIEDHVWTGQLTVTGDGAFPAFTLQLDVIASAMSEWAPNSESFSGVLSTRVLEIELEGDLQEPRRLTFSMERPSAHRRWNVHLQPTLSMKVPLNVKGERDVFTVTGSGRYSPPQISVELEEEIYRFEPADNGAGPFWGRGNSALIRHGDHLFVAGLETIPGAKPLNNVVPLLFQRTDDGWSLVYKGADSFP